MLVDKIEYSHIESLNHIPGTSIGVRIGMGGCQVEEMSLDRHRVRQSVMCCDDGGTQLPHLSIVQEIVHRVM